MVELVASHIRIIVFFGNAKIGIEIAREGYEREMYGELYLYVGPMWIGAEM